MSISPQDRQYLLGLARETIARRLEGEEPPRVNLGELSEPLRQPGASFVTLTIGGQLRGCIGSIQAVQPLALDVRQRAEQAAFSDPRFSPLTRAELDQVCIEVSVLTPPQPLEFADAGDLLAKLRPHVDGVLIERGGRQATFLPQVWEKLPDPREFMEHLCIKAWLSPDDYRRPGLKVYTYQVVSFSEEEE